MSRSGTLIKACLVSILCVLLRVYPRLEGSAVPARIDAFSCVHCNVSVVQLRVKLYVLSIGHGRACL